MLQLKLIIVKMLQLNSNHNKSCGCLTTVQIILFYFYLGDKISNWGGGGSYRSNVRMNAFYTHWNQTCYIVLILVTIFTAFLGWMAVVQKWSQRTRPKFEHGSPVSLSEPTTVMLPAQLLEKKKKMSVRNSSFLLGLEHRLLALEGDRRLTQPPL